MADTVSGSHPGLVDQVAPELIGQHGRSDSDFDEKTDDKHEITERDCEDILGFSFPAWKKWSILTGRSLTRSNH